ALAIAPYNVYPARDGWVAIFTASERHWHSIARVLDRADLLEHPDFASTPARAARMTEIDAMVEAWTRERTKDEVMAVLTRAPAPAPPLPHHRRGRRRPPSARARLVGRRRASAPRQDPGTGVADPPARRRSGGDRPTRAAPRPGHRSRPRRAARPRPRRPAHAARARRHRAGGRRRLRRAVTRRPSRAHARQGDRR